MNIEDHVNKIFNKRVKIDFSKNKNLYDESFFGYTLKVPVRELVLIFFDIEKTFNISILQEDIDNGMFYNYSNLIKYLENKYEISNYSIPESV